MGVVVKAVAMAGVVAMVVLALVLIAPHVQPLRPIAQSLGLIEVVNRTVVQYQVINHTVVKYVNETVPVYINRTVYIYVPTLALPEYYGDCNGRIVALPNGTGWIVLFMLINPRQYLQYWLEGLGIPYANNATHYAEFAPLFEPVDIIFLTAKYTVLNLQEGFTCITINYTINGYWPAVCGDVVFSGPTTLSGVNATALVEALGTNTTQTALIHIGGVLGIGLTPYMYIPCQITVTYAPNPTAALWLPATTNQTLLQYWREGEVEVYGSYIEYDWTMGFWVWLTPS